MNDAIESFMHSFVGLPDRSATTYVNFRCFYVPAPDLTQARLQTRREERTIWTSASVLYDAGAP